MSSQVKEIVDFHPHWNATINSSIKWCKLIVLWREVAKRGRERGLTQQAEASRDRSALQRDMGIAGHKKIFCSPSVKRVIFYFYVFYIFISICILMYIYTQINVYLLLCISIYIDLHVHKANILSQDKLTSITWTQPYHEHL